MKPFRFRLETLLRLRAAARDAEQGELARLLAELQRSQAAHEAVERELHERRSEERLLRRSEGFSLERLRQSESHRQELVAEQSRIAAEKTAVFLQVEVCQQRLAAAECEYQVIARLRDSRQAEHQREVVREEAKLAEEAARRTIRRAA